MTSQCRSTVCCTASACGSCCSAPTQRASAGRAAAPATRSLQQDDGEAADAAQSRHAPTRRCACDRSGRRIDIRRARRRGKLPEQADPLRGRYAPGGATDTIARSIGEKLQEYWGQPVVLEHRPGAGTNIATEAVARSPKDGHTLLLMTTANAINPTLYPRVRYAAMATSR